VSSPSSGPRTPQLPIGQSVGEKYRVVRLLGQGGMGAVYLVEHKSLGNELALKVLSGSSALHHARFGREARILASLRGEHVAKVVDFGFLEDTDAPYMVMEFLPGCDLSQLLDGRTEPLTVREAVDHVLEACEALAEAHQVGIVHRDVKPSNLFLTTRFDGSPMVKVLDFGIAKTESAPGDDTSLTATAMVFGSPAYMSPEQVRSSKRVGPQTDIWSMALVLYELVSKTHPFEGDSTAGIVAAIAADPPRPLPASIGPGLWTVLEAALRKDPTRRPQSIAAFASSLVRFGGERSRIVMTRIERLASRTDQTAELSQTRALMPSSPGIGSGSVPPVPVARAEELPSASARTTVGGRPRSSKSVLPLAAAGVLVVAIGAYVGLHSREALGPQAPSPAPESAAAVSVPSVALGAAPEASESALPGAAPPGDAPSPTRPAASTAPASATSAPAPGTGTKGGGKGRGSAPKASGAVVAPSGPGAPRQGEFN